MDTIKLSEYARRNSVTRQTAYKWYREGKLPGAHKTPGGSLVVDVPTEDNDDTIKTVIYARVSDSKRRTTDLEHQAERLKQFCKDRGYSDVTVVKEVGSGLNDSRRKLQKILRKPERQRIVVENKDRLTRFGFQYITTLIEVNGGEIIVVDKDDNGAEADLMEDLASIITSFCARLYGQRRGQHKSGKIKEVLHEADTNSGD